MDERRPFTSSWTKESATTRRVLARTPEGSSCRPGSRSRTNALKGGAALFVDGGAPLRRVEVAAIGDAA